MTTVSRLFSNFVKVLSYYVEYILYEIMFILLGQQSMFEDVLYRNRNRCELINKNGEVAIVTGGARGIGSALVKKLLQCDMTVIIGCRNIEAGLRSIENMRKDGVVSGEAHVYKLDLESLESVKEFTTQVKKNFSYLNLVVNNAGIMFGPYRETIDGFEAQFAVNYLSPFYLTHLLMPLLNKKESSRVVNVTSCGHIAAKQIQMENINMKKNFISSAAYAQSKLCQILFTLQLDRQLRERNSNVYILAVHPGIVNTDLFNGTPLKTLFPWVIKYFFKNVDAGATTVLAPCISPKFNNKGGIYLNNCCIISPSKLAQDVKLQNEIFRYSLKAVNISSYGE